MNEVTKAFERLELVLWSNHLPDGNNGQRLASAKEFMYMGHNGAEVAFKHIETRNYLWLTRDNNLILGDGVSAFEKHDFRFED